uniref:Uncharacterized protein n=1 Tax=Hordeum vulgare subsp. vulgare TaxID=112509 RepID=A0A8I6Y1H2_HORVV
MSHVRFSSVVVNIKLLKSTLKRFITDSDEMARNVNARHFKRLSNLLKDPAVAASITSRESQFVVVSSMPISTPERPHQKMQSVLVHGAAFFAAIRRWHAQKHRPIRLALVARDTR